MNVDHLYKQLKKTQEAQGYFFNPDKKLVLELLESLLANKERYGYMCCPCRLASGDREQDKDIICPCVYRKEDVSEYGSCYCGLYVSGVFNEGQVPGQYVPERRPVEKMLF